VESPALWVFFQRLLAVLHVPITGGEYKALKAPVPDHSPVPGGSALDLIGNWATIGTNVYAHPGPGPTVVFFPQLSASQGRVFVRLSKNDSSAIVDLYINGEFDQSIDLYSATPEAAEVDLISIADGDAAGDYRLELRHTGQKNPLSSDYFFYLFSVVVERVISQTEAVELIADFLVAISLPDGGMPDGDGETRFNFDALGCYACLGLLAANEVVPKLDYTLAVKQFLYWLQDRQQLDPNDPFLDGNWALGYIRVPQDPFPAIYVGTTSYYANWGIDEIRWTDSTQGLPAFLLWWYWKVTGDDATKQALLPMVEKAMDGYIRNNHDPQTGFFYSSWQHKTGNPIFIYHDGIRRYGSDDTLLEQHNDTDFDFFSYQLPAYWNGATPPDTMGQDIQYVLFNVTPDPPAYVEFSLALNEGDKLKWVTTMAPDSGIARIEMSLNGVDFSEIAQVDTYSASRDPQAELLLYEAPSSATRWFRIQHTGTINPAGNITPGWFQLQARYSPGQVEVAVGLIGLWLMTRKAKYAQLAIRMISRLSDAYWYEPDRRWVKGIDGPPPGEQDTIYWYFGPAGQFPWAFAFTHWFKHKERLAQGLETFDALQTPEGSFAPPQDREPINVHTGIYLMGENQLSPHTNEASYDLAIESLLNAIYLLEIDDAQVAAIPFSETYPYRYSGYQGYILMGLANSQIPFGEDLRLPANSVSRMMMPQRGGEE